MSSGYQPIEDYGVIGNLRTLEFAGLHAGLCRTLLTQMSELAESISAFQPYPLDHWRRPIMLFRSSFFGL